MNELLNRANEDKDILAVILFGSKARKESTRGSDTDICLVLFPGKHEPLNLAQKKLQYLEMGGGRYDIQIFQQLPLYIRRRVVKEGKILFVRDEDKLYDLAFRTAQAFELFKPKYLSYLAQVADAGS